MKWRVSSCTFHAKRNSVLAFAQITPSGKLWFTWSAMLASAPACSSSLTHSMKPSLWAVVRGVFPNCTRNAQIMVTMIKWSTHECLSTNHPCQVPVWDLKRATTTHARWRMIARRLSNWPDTGIDEKCQTMQTPKRRIEEAAVCVYDLPCYLLCRHPLLPAATA